MKNFRHSKDMWWYQWFIVLVIWAFVMLMAKDATGDWSFLNTFFVLFGLVVLLTMGLALFMDAAEE